MTRAITLTVGYLPDVLADGTVNCGPAIQQAYDDGMKVVLNAGGTYLVDSPVFGDRTSTYRGFEIDLNGAVLILGPNLPTVPAFYRDTTTKWAFFPNTKRVAWDQTAKTVDVTALTRASGPSVGNLMAMVFRNGTVDGQGANRALAFGNRTGSKFDRVVLRQGRALTSWFDYSDVCVLDACHNRKDTDVPLSSLVIQINPGDGVKIDACKADGGKLIADLKGCHGAVINASVTGNYKVEDCSGIVFNGMHQEAGISDTSNIDILDSNVQFNGGVIYPPRVSNIGAITIADTAAGSNVEMNFVGVHRLQAGGTNPSPDDPFGALVNIATAVGNTQLTVRNHFGTEVSTGAANDGWKRGSGGFIMSSGTPVIQAAIDTAAGKDAIASGNFVVSSYGISAGTRTWRVRVANGESTDTRSVGVMGPPTLLGAANTTSGGALTAATSYSYVCAMYDALDHHTEKSAEVSVTSGAGGCLRLEFNAPRGGRLKVWRKLGAGAGTSPTHVAELRLSTPKSWALDTGTYIGGSIWVATAVAPPTTNDTVAARLIDGVAV